MTAPETFSSLPSLLSFSLPGLLPPESLFYLDQGSNVVALFQHQEPMPKLLSIRQLTDIEFDLLVPLVRAYPAICPYQVLYQAVLPRSFSPQQVEAVVRPVRRAIGALQPALLTFGIRIVPLRNHGYFLRQLT